MVNAQITVKSKNRLHVLRELLKEIKETQVYVGIPEEKAPRAGEPVSNAQLAFLHTHGVRSLPMRREMEGYGEINYGEAYAMYLHAHGSALWHIPPRPIIEPAIAQEKEPIAEELGDAAKAALDGSRSKMMVHLKRAGILGQNASRAWFTNSNNQWPPNAPATIEAKGSDKPLIDTGQLRRSITYVVKAGEQIEGGYAGD